MSERFNQYFDEIPLSPDKQFVKVVENDSFFILNKNNINGIKIYPVMDDETDNDVFSIQVIFDHELFEYNTSCSPMIYGSKFYKDRKDAENALDMLLFEMK